MRSFNVGSNTRTLRGPKIMERGEIGWAGGSAGPDFFVYLGKYPADWLGHDHTVFGVLEDEASLAVAEKIVAMDSHTPGGPNTMRFLREKMTFDVVAAEE
jgi:cyclophilin family peptidyl-prolyl cis-trans isomerase